MTELAAQIQAILFSSADPVKPDALAVACEVEPDRITAALGELSDALEGTGLRLSELGSAYRLVTAPELTPVVARFHDQSLRHDLSKPALETLAIIAYQGPISRNKIEELRGVGSEQMLRNLLQRGLIEEAGRSKEPGRPALYAVTTLFLDTVGLTNLSQLPPLPDEETAA